MEKKVLMLVDALDAVNGVSITARQLAENWNDPEWYLTVYGTGGSEGVVENTVYPNSRVHVARASVSMPMMMYQDIVLAFPIAKTWRELRGHSRGIIHAAAPGTLGMRSMWYAMRLGIPYVSTYHTRLSVYARLYVGERFADQADRMVETMMRMQYSRSIATFVHSPAAADEAREYGAKNVVYAPMGIPVPYSNSNDLQKRRHEAREIIRAELSIPEDQPILLYVGRLALEKSVDILCDAAEKLNYPFIVVGDGPMRDVIARSPHLMAVGMKHGEDLENLYLGADVFISASITETLGRIFLESLAYGTPIILPDSGQQNSLLPDGHPAIIKFRRDADYVGLQELVQTIHNFVHKSREERQQFSAPALEFASQYSWDNVLSAHVEPYNDILREYSSRTFERRLDPRRLFGN